tara:strand:- start:624 stop:1346 length:723 start_codon:yes stop_codon:yes gene_type:complete
MKNIVQIFIILSFLSCQNDRTVDPAKFKTIMIKSYGEVETLPDVANFHISLNCLDSSIKASKNCLVEKSNDLVKVLKSFGVAEEDILTTAVNLHRSYTYRNNTRVFEGYRSSTSVFVTVKNIENLDEIYTELLENRNLELGELSYSHSKIDSIKNEAYVNALENAGVLADKLLEKLPETEKEILKIGNVEISASLPQERNAEYQLEAVEEAQSANAASIAINKGTVKVKAILFVEYQILE